MKIELGGTYKTKNNTDVKITGKSGNSFVGTIEALYDEDGKVLGWNTGHYMDLVLPAPEEPRKQSGIERLKEIQELRKQAAELAKNK